MSSWVPGERARAETGLAVETALISALRPDFVIVTSVDFVDRVGYDPAAARPMTTTIRVRSPSR